MNKNSPPQTEESTRSMIDVGYHFLEWLVTALASTLVFIIFMMQVYRIPTGSMADTLKGAHFRLRCEQCGYRYEYDFSPSQYHLRENVVPHQDLPINRECRCPSCGYAYRMGLQTATKGRFKQRVYKGDQIFVLKCIYQFTEPRRWDVVVFKNPLEPRINYIKRLVGKPGETIEIIDGDIYIDDRIMRKPPKVQEELWMPIYDNDYIPARPREDRFNRHTWRQPFENVDYSHWDLSDSDPTIFSLNSTNGRIHRIQYNPQIGNNFRAAYAYDPPEFIPRMPICSDLMVRCFPRIGDTCSLGVELGKYGFRYQGWIYADGRLEILRVETGQEPVLLESCMLSDSFATQPLQEFRFTNLDHQLILEYGTTRLVYDLGRGAEDAGIDRSIWPEVAILGSGIVELRHISVFRDIHYINNNILRAGEGEPFTLGEDEFFMCGDNSPFSLDSRLWNKAGLGNNGKDYPAGIVPRDYLVGKAFFVHWPGGYQVIPNFFRFIPYVEGMKVIHGGIPGWDESEAVKEVEM